jgi:Spy/CpxP family protein refolding chaperone
MGRKKPMDAKHCGPDCLLIHADVLGLTEDQKEELRDLEYAAHEKLIDLKAALQKERLELRKLMNEDELNAEAIKRQLDAVFGAEADVKYVTILTVIKARKLLTEGQRTLLEEKYHGHGGK